MTQQDYWELYKSLNADIVEKRFELAAARAKEQFVEMVQIKSIIKRMVKMRANALNKALAQGLSA